MSRNIKLILSYDGTDYCGWQVQNGSTQQRMLKGRKSVQAVLEDALSRVTGEHVKITGSGRTDAGVHALGQVANFKSRTRIPCSGLRAALNFRLPDDIKCVDVSEVCGDFHSRFSAKSKIYRYLILSSKDRPVLLNSRLNYLHYDLDTDLMRSELAVLRGKHDFRSFCASFSKIEDTRRTVFSTSLKVSQCGQIFRNLLPRGKSSLIAIEIEADGFLPYMMRNIIGTLIEVGRGKMPRGSFRRILRAKDRSKAGPTAAAGGLYLVKVSY